MPTHGERIAALETGAEENAASHKRIERMLSDMDGKLDTLCSRQVSHLSAHRFARYVGGLLIALGGLAACIWRACK